MSEGTYDRPSTLEEAKRVLARRGEEATIVGGGQTLTPLATAGVVSLDVVVDVSTVPELTRIETTDRTTTVGGAATYRDVLSSGARTRHPMLGETASVIADRQVRAMGTIGGALASGQPSLDIVPTLYCLDATVLIGSVDGRRRVSVPALYPNATRETETRGDRSDFLGLAPVELKHDELVEAVEIPVRSDDDHRGGNYRKLTNVAGGRSTVGVGTRVELTADREAIETARVGLAAVGRTGATATSVESALEGMPATGRAIDDALDRLEEDVTPRSTFSSEAYVVAVAKTLASRSLAASIKRAGGDPA